MDGVNGLLKKWKEKNIFSFLIPKLCKGIEDEMDFNTDVYELRFSGFNAYFEKEVEITFFITNLSVYFKS